MTLGLEVSTPLGVVVAVDDLVRIDLEDRGGAFTLRPGHADLVAVIVPSVLTWERPDGETSHAAVADAILVLERGRARVMTGEAWLGDSPEGLLAIVRAARGLVAAEIAAARTQTASLEDAARRRLIDLTRKAPPGMNRIAP